MNIAEFIYPRMLPLHVQCCRIGPAHVFQTPTKGIGQKANNKSSKGRLLGILGYIMSERA